MKNFKSCYKISNNYNFSPILLTFWIFFQGFFKDFDFKQVKLRGENAIASFSFAGLTFPGGEMPVRLICRPYFCRWKIASLGLPVTKGLFICLPDNGMPFAKVPFGGLCQNYGAILMAR